MKFSFKIAIFAFVVILFSLGLGGFLIINSCFHNELDINLNATIENNKYLSTIYYSIANNNLGTYTEDTTYLLKEFQSISNNGQVFIGEVKDIKYYDENGFANKLKKNEQGSQIIRDEETRYIQVITKLNIDKKDIYIESLTDISKIYDLRDKNYKTYYFFLIVISFICSVITYLFSIHITKPLEKLKHTSNLIANGNLSERIPTTYKEMKSEEFVSLANDFNNMAGKLENYINELQDYSNRQDEFIARFTHELKTPLTSIIGYSDILRTYDIDPNKKYELASYIYKEGKRLEDLSHHLLQLILLKKDDFTLKRENIKLLFKDIKSAVTPLLQKYKIEMMLEIEDAYILVEATLFKSLLYNLIDNACKASKPNSKIRIMGKRIKKRYQITVQDFGKGIPKESIDKVIIPFYMVDKSRARKQGGAGIGLALCNEIAKIHHSSLNIDSIYGKFTKISFDVEVEDNAK